MWKHDILSALQRQARQRLAESETIENVMPGIEAAECIHIPDFGNMFQLAHKLSRGGDILFYENSEHIHFPFEENLFVFKSNHNNLIYDSLFTYIKNKSHKRYTLLY